MRNKINKTYKPVLWLLGLIFSSQLLAAQTTSASHSMVKTVAQYAKRVEFTFHVYDAADSMYVRDIQVKVNDMTLLFSSTNGIFHLFLPAGAFKIQVAGLPGYDWYSFPVFNLKDREKYDITLYLKPGVLIN